MKIFALLCDPSKHFMENFCFGKHYSFNTQFSRLYCYGGNLKSLSFFLRLHNILVGKNRHTGRKIFPRASISIENIIRIEPSPRGK